jgi:hypothetical protein
VEDITAEVVEREHECVVLTRCWIGDRAERHRQTRWGWKELVKSGCS